MTAVLLAPGDRDARYPDRLRHPSPGPQAYFLEGQGAFLQSPPPEYSSPVRSSTPSTVSSSSEFASISSHQLPYTANTASSLSLRANNEWGNDDILLPSYDADDYSTERGTQADPSSAVASAKAPPEPLSTGTSTPDSSQPMLRTANDDTSVEEEPSRHVDYLSHEWREEDIWASWRYVVSRRNVYGNSVRLENASWRTWAKSKYKLRTVSPETLNWLKDCDVTWLYGPLQTDSKRLMASNTSPPSSRLETPSSFLEKKSILKKKTASETILQHSLSQHMLLKHAGAILKAQEAENSRGRSSFERATSDVGVTRTQGIDSAFASMGTTPTNTTSSGLVSPSERRHIHFNNEVVQCIAVEVKDGEDENDYWSQPLEDDESSDDGLVMMKRFSSRVPISNRRTPRNSFSGENKTIAPLPPTTLKYRGDAPEYHTEPTDRCSGWLSTSKLSPTPSVETLRPPKPQANFLLDDDDDNELDMNWQPKRSSYASGQHRPWFVNPEDEEELENGRELHLTPSGMFMPYEEGKSSTTGIFGRVVDTVNTARDIAHVIWNVGWRR